MSLFHPHSAELATSAVLSATSIRPAVFQGLPQFCLGRCYKLRANRNHTSDLQGAGADGLGHGGLEARLSAIRLVPHEVPWIP